ncbi:MAG: YitT family protein [Parachlamydiales bacterium]|nr:YitT family protein [Parachlamydiales bacterium]
MTTKKTPKTFWQFFSSILITAIGALLAAISIRIFLLPNKLIDGGVVGISLILARVFSDKYLSYFLVLLNLPFLYLAYKHIRKSFVVNMFIATVLFAAFLSLLQNAPPFDGDFLEIIVIGGVLLGAGVGFIIKSGGCTDGTEILAIIVNRKTGFTVGQIILTLNIFIFAVYGWIFKDWHIALKSLMTYIVAFKMIDIVIAGLDEVKSVTIMTSKPKKITELIMHELGLGLTIIPGIGGFSGEDKDILFLIVERLDLAELKDLVLSEDPTAFMAIENLHEVAYGRQISRISHKKTTRKKRRFFSF